MRLGFKAKFVLTFASLAAALVVLVASAHIWAIHSWNESQLAKYSENAVYRAEILIDHTIFKVRETGATYFDTCDASAIEGLRRIVFTYGAIKDIRVRNGDTDCWAFGDIDQPVSELVENAPRLEALNPDYCLFVLNGSSWTGLGVEWKEGSDRTVSIIVSAENVLNDIVPAEIRDQTTIRLDIADGGMIAHFSGQHFVPGTYVEYTSFDTTSERYPLLARLHLESQRLWSWNVTYPPAIAGLIVIGLLIAAYFITKGLIRDRGLAGELKAAIKRREIRPYYQPIMDLRSGNLAGFEILARWIKSDGNIISPDKFIPFAEENGLIDHILAALLKTAGEEVGPLLRQQPELKMTFNVTPEQYVSEGFVENLLQTLDQAGIPRGSAVVEVTERQSVSDGERAAEVSAQLTKAGIRIAIDDAGTGHNGLSSIHSLDAQYLKIDKYFVDGLLLDRKTATIIEMLTSVAREFGMSVVAEGVESAEQAEMLKKLGIPEAQGYHYSRPVPSDMLLDFAKNSPAKAAA